MKKVEYINICKESLKSSTIDDIADLKKDFVNIKNKLFFELDHEYSNSYSQSKYYIIIKSNDKNQLIKKIEIEREEYNDLIKLKSEKIDELTEDFLRDNFPTIISFPQPPKELRNLE